MEEIQIYQQDIQAKILQNLIDIQLQLINQESKICKLLNIQTGEIQIEKLKPEVGNLNVIQTILRKIYNKLLKNSLIDKNTKQTVQIKKVDDENSHINQLAEQEIKIYQDFENPQKLYSKSKQEYSNLQDLLQKEQTKNRLLLRKQFEFKQYQVGVLQDLTQEKQLNDQLNKQIKTMKDSLQEKDVQISHLRNQVKFFERGSKETNHLQRAQIFKPACFTNPNQSNHLTLNLHQYGQFDNKKISSSRDLIKQTGRKTKDKKQKGIYALYNNHKKRNSELINLGQFTDKTKKASITQRTYGKKTIQKALDTIEYSNKKANHLRRKSQQVCKKTPSQKQGKQGKLMKKRKQTTFQRIIRAT